MWNTDTRCCRYLIVLLKDLSPAPGDIDASNTSPISAGHIPRLKGIRPGLLQRVILGLQ